MNRDAIERIFLGNILQPGEQLYFVALGSAYAATLREHATNLKQWSKNTLKNLTPGKVVAGAGVVAGAAVLSLLPEAIGDAVEAVVDREDAKARKARGEQPQDEFTVEMPGSLLALSSARLMLVLVHWTKAPHAPWEATIEGLRCWSAEQIREAPLRFEERSKPFPVLHFRLGDDGAQGGYHFGKYPGFPYNLEQAIAIAERVRLARQG